MQELKPRPFALGILVFINDVGKELIRNAVALLKIARGKLQKLQLIVLDKRKANTIEIRQPVAVLVQVPVRWVAFHNEVTVRCPRHKTKWARSDGMLEEVLAVILHSLTRDDTHGCLRDGVFEGGEGLHQSDDKRRIVRCLKSLHTSNAWCLPRARSLLCGAIIGSCANDLVTEIGIIA